jgi:hypothetical protein
VSNFDESVLEAARSEREIELTTFGRISNEPATVTLWITPVGDRLYLRSGAGIGRDWTKNLAAHRKGILHIGGSDVPITARHVSDLAEAKNVTRACARKYGTAVATTDDDTASPAETATFELFPVEA